MRVSVDCQIRKNRRYFTDDSLALKGARSRPSFHATSRERQSRWEKAVSAIGGASFNCRRDESGKVAQATHSARRRRAVSFKKRLYLAYLDSVSMHGARYSITAGAECFNKPRLSRNSQTLNSARCENRGAGLGAAARRSAGIPSVSPTNARQSNADTRRAPRELEKTLQRGKT